MDRKLREWLFIFLRKDGSENRMSFLCNLVSFLNTEDWFFEVSEHVFLSGLIYGQDRFNVGSKIITDFPVGRIEKVDRRLRVFLTNGDTYYMYMEDANYFMDRLLQDMISFGEINEQTGFYLPRAFNREIYL